MVKKLQDAIDGGIEPIPLGRLLGFRVAAVEPGYAVIEIETTAEHANPMGTLHGGVLCSIADSAMGIAHASSLNEGETTTTLELKINFLRPVWSDRLRAVGRVIKPGRTVSLVECDVFDSKDRLVARSSSTCMTLRGDQAEGRQVK
ncbi:MAG: PaaI family thioesterase [Acidobacteriaceae bacterium]|nr:PaaI family thioesterase [Acidobacteriaceae bacterium]